MPRITRKTQQQFGSSAGAEEIAKFGSFAAGAPVYSTDPAVIQALTQYLQGWYGASVGDSPTIEDRNALDYLFAYQLRYLLQAGIPEWDAGTTYFTGQVVSVGNQYGFQYVSLADDNLNHAVTDTLYWRKIDGQVTSTKTSAFTISAADNGCIFPCNTTGGAFNITLPTGGAAKNFSFTVKDANGTFATNPVTIVRIGSETIEGASSNYVCNRPARSYRFVCDGTNWHIIANSVDTKPGTGDTMGESIQTLAGFSATGLNIVGNTSARWASIIQQKNNTASNSLGLLCGGGTNSSDFAAAFVDAAGNNIGRFRGDKILEMVGGGIKFPVTQVSSSDANVFDDYEEGTWTPSLAYSTPGTSSFTYSQQAGYYIKIGRFVFISFNIALSAFSKGTASGTLFVANAPFSPTNESRAYHVLIPTLESWTFSNTPVGYMVNGNSNIFLYTQASGSSFANLGDPGSSAQITGNLCYRSLT